MAYKHIGVTCKICGGKVVGRQLCELHYRRAKRAGELQKHQFLSTEDAFKMRYKIRESGCWEWIGGRNANGYGVIHLPGHRQIRAHQLSYLLHKGEIKKGLYVLHSCDNKICVNPDHLRLGTHTDNMKDAISRDRTAKGEGNGNAAVTEKIVRSIRASYPDQSLSTLASRYSISKATVYQIVTRVTWKHIP